MNDQDAFLELIGNLEYLRKHKKLTPNGAYSILSGVPLTIYADTAKTDSKTDTKSDTKTDSKANSQTILHGHP